HLKSNVHPDSPFEGADRGPPSTDHPIARPTAWAMRSGRFISGGAHRQETNELIEDQTGGTMPPAEATAEAPTSEERAATTAVADAPAQPSEPASEPAAPAATPDPSVASDHSSMASASAPTAVDEPAPDAA